MFRFVLLHEDDDTDDDGSDEKSRKIHNSKFHKAIKTCCVRVCVCLSVSDIDIA